MATRPKPPCPVCHLEMGMIVYSPPREGLLMVVYWCVACKRMVKKSEVGA